MNLEDNIKSKLSVRGFTKEQLLNNRGLIGAAIDETIIEVVKNFNNEAVLENVTERNEIKCHSGTPKEDLIAFVETNKGKAIEIHFENNFGAWGDDEIFTYDTDNETFYNEALRIVKNHYVHNIKCVG